MMLLKFELNHNVFLLSDLPIPLGPYRTSPQGCKEINSEIQALLKRGFDNTPCY